MTENIVIALSCLGAMFVLIYVGMHVAIALGGISLVGVWLIRGDFAIAANMLAQAASDAIASHVFGIVPLFVLMGFLVAAADVGRDAFEVANQLFRRIRGGLGIATVAANAVFAAITGISIASAAVFTRVAVPEMLRFNYTPRFAVGVVTGSSVLGMLIPPSLLMIVYGFLSNESIGSMFLAGLVPGALLALTYCIGIMIMARYFPRSVGGPNESDQAPLMSIGTMIAKVVPSFSLILLCLGGIYAGFFTPTEGGAMGAAGALVLALIRRKLSWTSFWKVLLDTGHVTVSVCFLIICANMFSRMLAMSGTPQFLIETIKGAGFGELAFLLVYLVVIIALGTIIDSISIMLICLPLVLPVASGFGMDLIWFGIVTIIAVEIGLLTPPFGLSAFVVKSTLNDPRISLGDIFKGSFPFVVMMLIVLALVVAFPKLSLVLV
ncbi:MAG: TRAP transporter large permease subunit [Phreatobacter sp.]|uniref:TRAP transporter large permease n=1 Tax=Phreatobacter sp. TaxID=1966341 RepID=UPI001A4C3E31|nr:TRAP transporter large permease subunit [Phreatobacter sp.]MBL8569562.1 TRAP transporter large permease subunit [Phreatobacter sp.]